MSSLSNESATPAKKSKSAKGWQSEVRPDLKMRIRSPDTATTAAAAVKEEDLPPVLTPAVVCSAGDDGLAGLPGPSNGTTTAGGRDDDEDSAFESNGRNEDDLDDELDNEQEVTFE